MLVQPPTNDFYMLTPVEETRLTREEVLESLPLDMRPFVIVHDYESDFAAYPLLGANDDPNGHQTWHWVQPSLTSLELKHSCTTLHCHVE